MIFVLNVPVDAFNQEKALVYSRCLHRNLREPLFEALERPRAAYLDQIILGTVLSITVFPMAVGFYEVGFLLAVSILLDKTLLQLQDKQEL